MRYVIGIRKLADIVSCTNSNPIRVPRYALRYCTLANTCAHIDPRPCKPDTVCGYTILDYYRICLNMIRFVVQPPFKASRIP